MKWEFEEGSDVSKRPSVYTGHHPLTCPEAGETMEILRSSLQHIQLQARAERARWFFYGALTSLLTTSATVTVVGLFG